MKRSGKNFRLTAVFIFIIAVVFFGGIAGRKGVAQSGGSDCSCVANEVIFELANPANLSAVAAQYNLNPTPLGQAGTPATYRMQITGGQTPAQTVAAMQADARIAKPEVNRKLSSVERENLNWTVGHSWSVGRSWSVGGSAKGYGHQWFKNKIRLDEAFAQGGTRGAGVTVAVLDTGIDAAHPAFAGRLVAGYDFVDNDNNPAEVGALRQGAFGHGTHVAGIVALVAPDAKIMPIRILDSNGEGELWRVTQAVIWAANHGANVINISFGYPETAQILKDLLDACDDGLTVSGKTFSELNGNRLIISAAAGNGGNASPIFPAAEGLNDSELGVGATTRYDLLTNFSTYNRDFIRVVAPGDSIVSALPGGFYGVWSGTSMSAPVVSGIAALVRAKYPNQTVRQTVEQIKETGVKLDYTDAARGRIQTKRVDALCAVTNNLSCSAP